MTERPEAGSARERSAQAFLSELRARGVELWLEEDALRYRAPAGELTPEDLDELRRRKPELVARLRDAGSMVRRAEEIERAPRDRPLPLSFAQQRLWFLEHLGAGAAYHMPWAFELHGELDREALEKSINALVERHETLRTRFPSVDGTPTQDILAFAPVTLEYVDISQLDEAPRRAEALRLYEERANQPFDLERGPLLRPTLVRLGPESHVLFLIVHHIVFDGWSLGVVLRDLGAYYEAFTTGAAVDLPELSIQYADFAAWQRERLQGEVLEQHMEHCRERLAGMSALDLRPDRPRPAVQTFTGAAVPLELPEALSAGVVDLGRRCGTTLATTLLAAFQVLLSRYSGQDDVVVGVPVAVRNHLAIEDLIGLFVNTLVLRTDLSRDPTVAEVLEQVHESSLAAHQHQELPFERIVDEFEPERDLSRNPLFQVVFVMRNAPTETGDLAGLQIKPFARDVQTVRFDLELNVIEVAGRIGCNFIYNVDIFDRATIERMAGHFRSLLEGMVANPEARIADLSLLDAAERHEVLGDWSAARDFGGDACLHELFEARAAGAPDRVAVQLGQQCLTYGELNARANRLAERLREEGVGPETRVGLLVERDLDLIVGLLGVLKAGGAYVPLDPVTPARRLAFVLEDAQIAVVLTQERLAHRLADCDATVLCIDAEGLSGVAGSEDGPPRSARPENAAYVIYTSGSTGRPKGVVVEHRQVTRLFAATAPWYGFGEDDTWTLFHSSAFDFSVWEIWGSLLHGGRLVVVPYEVSRSPQELHALVCREGVTVLNQTPSAFRQFIRADKEQPGGELVLRWVIFGGEALELESLRPWFERHGDDRPRLVNMYGITETTVHVTYRPLRLADLDQAPGSVIGRPIPDLRVCILDSRGEPQPIGVPGEVHVGGAGVARGYLHRPGLTAQRYVPDPFAAEPGARLYRTGDLARRLANGDIEYLGRNDDQVKIRGFRIELGEVEAALGQHEGVRETVAMVRKHDSGDVRLVAYAVLQDEEVTPTELRAFAAERLPNYMVPAAIVTLDALPLTPNGKIDRDALPVPADVRRLDRELVEPRTHEEKVLAEIWADLLRIDAVGVHDNFFELGGDSILSLQIVVRAREAGLWLKPRAIFQHQTIAGLAGAAEDAAPADVPQEPVTGEAPLTPIQRWFFAQDRREPQHYNQAFVFTVTRRFTPEVWRGAFECLLVHHDALRLRFLETDGEWRQHFAAPGDPLPFEVVDLSGHEREAQAAAVEARAQEIGASLDLRAGPILRAVLFELGPESHQRLVIAIHHLAVDGVSWGILREDLERACEQLDRGEVVELPPKTTSFASWAESLERAADTDALHRQGEVWLGMPWSEAAPLPVDHHGENTVASAGRVTIALSEEETRSLLRDVPSAYNTRVDEVLLAALAGAMAPWTGRSHLLVDLEGHGRDAMSGEVDVSRTVGWFTAIYPVLLSADEEPGPALMATKERLRAVREHGPSYGILRYLGANADTSAALGDRPRAEVLFNYLGRFDAEDDGAALLVRAAESAGDLHSPRSLRTHLLEINSAISGDRLAVSFVHSTQVHGADTVQGIADRFLERLRATIAHCTASGAGAYTPSDFPLAKLDQPRLDRLAEDLGPGAVEDVYPLSPMQQGMLFHTVADPDAGTYVEQLRFTIDGLDAEAFQRAWAAVVARHPTLRMAIIDPTSAVPLQVVLREVPVDFTTVDCRELSEAERELRIEELRAHEERDFDLSTAPLLRLALARCEDRRYEFLWTFHHIVLDGWSFARVLNEVLAIYGAGLRGEEAELPHVRPYRDYVAWLQARDSEETRAYWGRTLGGIDQPTPIGPPGRRRLPHRRTERYETEVWRLSEAETLTLQELAGREQVTLNTLVLGAWSLLLGRDAGVRDVVLGTVVSGRPGELEGVESMVGMFVNTLPLRVDVDEELAVGAWLRAVQERQAELREYEHSALWEAQQAASLPPGTPLFESLYVFENYPIDVSALGESSLRLELAPTLERTGYPLTLSVGVGSYMAVRVTWDGARFEAPWVLGVLERLRVALAAFAANPEQPVGRVSLSSEAERRRQLVEWNATARPYPDDRRVEALFAEQASRLPASPAVSFDDGTLTYAELDQRADRLASHLCALGVECGDLVPICVERGVDLVVGILGILKAGAAYVPLDPDQPAVRLALMLKDAQGRVLLTQEHLLSALPSHDGSTVCLDRDWQTIAAATAEPAIEDAGADEVAYVVYTSGSTGRPKGVCVPHRAIARLVRNSDYVQLGPTDRVAQISNASFDAATFEIWGALLNGGELASIGKDVLLDPVLLAEVLRGRGITAMFVTTAFFNQVAVIAPEAFATLRCLLFGGEAVDPDRVRAVCAHGAPDRLLHVYGPTENTTFSTWYEVEGVPEDATTVPIGRPIANTTVYVLGPDREPLPIGAVGELYLGGDGLAVGYLGRSDLTTERFVPDPFSGRSGARLYRTGDLVRYRSDGDIEFVGRHDHQIKLRGFRIELGEIEAALSRCAGVRHAVVLCRQDVPDEKELVAYVVVEEGSVSPADLRRGLGGTLPDYMIPTAFVALDALPLSPNGKVDRRALPAPVRKRQVDEGYVAPRSELEERIASVWRAVLELDEVGVRDNFFDLGGHSLRVLQVHGRLVELGYEVTITELFQYPTIETLAERLSGVSGPASSLRYAAASRVTRRRATDEDAVAIVGMAGRFPDAPDLDAFWRNLRDGVESIRSLTDEELLAAGVDAALIAHPNYVKVGSVLEDAGLFDAAFFGYTPREAELIDPQQRVFLECAWQALEHAGYDPERFPGMIGVYAGSSVNTYLNNLRTRPDLIAATGGLQTFISSDKDFLATRLSYKLDLRGPSVSVQTACSTSLVAVHEACRSLLDQQCDLALAGGVSISVPEVRGYLFEEGGIFSPDGHCRAFDARARGTISGSGVGIVVLKRLAEAVRDGDVIHAVVRGTAINNDGSNKVGYTAPSVEGQAEVVALAQAAAGVDPSTISYIEAHGTGTPLGDPIEVAALTKVFREDTRQVGVCAIGTLKTNMGHLDAAAGVAGLLKTVLALKHREIPPSLHFESPNAEIDFASSPFFVNTERRPWVGAERRAGVSSFGMGGTNAHVVVEEAPAAEPSRPGRRHQLLVQSARSEAALDSSAGDLARHLRAQPDVNLADVAYTLQVGRHEFEHRRVAVCEDAEQAVVALDGGDPSRVLTGTAVSGSRDVVFLFPGQGAQYVGMGRGLYDEEPVFRAAMDHCLAFLEGEMALGLRAVLYADEHDEAAAGRLTDTTFAQPALFAVEYALSRLWRSWGVEPRACIGHSVGELTAACVAGVLSLEDALRLAVVRGRTMARMPAGVMTAVPLPEADVSERVAASPELWLSAVNGPSLCVVSGTSASVEELESRLSGKGVECRRLHTSHAFHSGLMDGAVEPFVEAVRGVALAAPAIPCAANVTGEWMTAAEACDPAYWGRHLREPVQFAAGLARLLEDRSCALLEVGPGRVLTSLARQHPDCGEQRVVAVSLRDPRSKEPDRSVALGALGRLWVEGVRVDWPEVHGGERRRRVVLPTYPFERQRYWIEPAKTTLPSRSARRADLADWFYAPSWRRTQAPAAADATATRLVLSDGTPFAEQVIASLENAGCPVVVAESGARFAEGDGRFVVDPTSRDDYRDLLEALAQTDRTPRYVTCLLECGPVVDRMDEAAAERCLEHSFHGPIALVQALDAAGVAGAVGIDMVTAGVYGVTGDEALCPERATVLGPCLVIGRELPQVRCRQIDLAPEEVANAPELAERVASELLAVSAQAVVALRGDRRHVQELTPTSLGAVPGDSPGRLRQGATYLITGGLGGIGLELARHLVRAAGANLVLTSRTALPDRAKWSRCLADPAFDERVRERIQAVQALEQLGAQVMVAAADVTDGERMRAVLAEAGARLGPVRGVIHAAGVPGEGVILRKERAQAEQVLAPKVLGTRVLEQLCGELEFDFVVLCSSLASALGIAGQVDYCAANAYLDAAARNLVQRTGTYTVAIGWNRWREVGMAVDAARERGRAGELEGSSNREGVELFQRVLAWCTEPNMVIAEREPSTILEPGTEPGTETGAKPASAPEPIREAGHARPSLPTDYVAPRTEAERVLAEIWGSLLGIEAIGVHDNFFDLGGHSLLATQVMARVREALQVEAPIAAVFDAPTVAELAAAFGGAASEEPVSASAEPKSIPSSAIVPRERSGAVPMSFHQQRLWILDQIEPGLAIYNNPSAYVITGELDEHAFVEALRHVVQRHEVLRTSFRKVDGEPVQIVRDDVAIELVRETLAGLDETERQAELKRRIDELVYRPFDLEQGPLVRAALFHLAEDETAFLLVMHHIVTDAWSLGIIHREVGVLYEALRRGRPSPLEPPSLQYADFSAWQRDWLRGDELDRQMAFWREQLAGAPPVHGLPMDRPRPPVPSYGGATIRFELSEEQTAALNVLVSRNQVSPFMVLLALFKVLLARWSGERDIVIGTPIAGRQHIELEELVGFFVNTVVLRTRLGEEPSFVEVLERVRQGALAAFAHQDMPFEQLVDDLQQERHLDISPLFQVAFMVQNAPLEPFEFDDLRVAPLALDYHLSKYDLTLTMIEGRGGWAGHLEYSTALFDRATIERLVTGYQVLAEALLADPQRPVTAVPLIAEDEQTELVLRFNATSRAHAPDRAPHELFEEVAGRAPESPAVSCGDRTLTYGQLNAWSNRVAHRLRELGARPGTVVAIGTERSVEMTVALLGVLKAGAAYLPVDPSHPRARRAFLLEDAGARVVLATREHAEEFPTSLDVVRLDADGSDLAGLPDGNQPSNGGPDNLVYVLYTSGSTGRPKGVAVTRAGLSNYLAWGREQYGLGPGDTTLVHSPLGFDLTVTGLLLPLILGGRVRLVPEERGVEGLAEALGAEGEVGLVKLTPTHLQLLGRQLAEGDWARVRTYVVGGEDLTAEHVSFWERSDAPTRVVNEYGPTETVVGACAYEVPRGAHPSGSIPIGGPIANARLYVLDGALNPVPRGAVGELFIGGAGVARGYVGRPDLTAERFVPDPFGVEPGGRLYRTGDLARHLPEAGLLFLGRRDEQVKVRGHRIELGEIAGVLLEHPQVTQAVAAVREDRPGDRILAAYVVGAGGAAPPAAELRGFLRERLPEPVIPSSFQALESLPLTANGKVDRRALPAPGGERDAEGAYLAPRGRIEERIASVWRDVLGVERVGVRDNFFDLGGHSLRAIEVHARLAQSVDGGLTVLDMFQHPTVEALAKRLAGTAATGSLQSKAAARVRRRAGADAGAIAVVGIAGRFPGAADPESFWSNLRSGVESVRFFGDDELREAGVPEALLAHPNYVKARAVLDGADLFDARFFDYSPREALLIDPQQRIFLECASQALERAGYDPDRYSGMIGVWGGASMNTYLANIQSQPGLLDAGEGMQAVINNDKDFLPTRVSYKLNLRGPSVNVQTACSTSLVAVHEACQSLLAHRCDMALAGGVAVTVPLISGYLYQEEGIAAPDGHCRPFDARARGTLGGNGVGVVVLKRLDDALRDGDHIHAVVRGTATNNDGSHKVGYTAPSVEGQAEVVAMAQAFAGVEPETIGFIEAHGTGTALGDPIEVAALTRVFRERTDKTGVCALGSIKSNMGHLDAAAGVAGFMKAVLAVENGEIPPSLHFEAPNPEIDFDETPFFVNTRCRTWSAGAGVPRRAGVSSFGIGGTNAHVVLEEAPPVEPSGPSRPRQILVLSAKSESALTAATANLAAHLRADPDANLADVAYTLQVGRRNFEHRRAVVCHDAAEAIRNLEGGAPESIFTGRTAAVDRPVAFLFPGQGAQYPGMALDLYGDEPVFREALDRCLQWFDTEVDLDLRSALHPPAGATEAAAERLQRTSIAQPALFAVQYALAELWRSWGIEPSACIGHSIGEFVAATLAGVFDLEDALRLVAIRGWLMEQMPAGAMTAVPLSPERVRERIEDHPDLWLAAVNGPSLCVVSGATEAVESLESALGGEGVESRRLRTSGAFHSGLMDEAVAPFVEAVGEVELGQPSIPYLSNVTGEWITAAEATDPAYWGRHLREPVRFSDAMGRLLADSDHALVEVGPGRVLGTLARQLPECGADRVIVPSLPSPGSSAPDTAFAMEALARLWIGGVEIDWSRLHAGERRRRVVLPTYPFERTRYWIDRRPATQAAPRAEIDDWFHVPGWQRTRMPEPLVAPLECLVIAEEGDFARSLVAGLRRAGRCVEVAALSVDGDVREHYRTILTRLASSGRAPAEVIHLGGLAPPTGSGADDAAALRLVDRCFHDQVALLQALDDVGIGGPLRLQVVTSEVHELDAGDRVCPEKAVALGLCRVVPRELPHVTCRHIDLSAAEVASAGAATAEALAGELLATAEDRVVALRAGKRFVETFARVPLAARDERPPDVLRPGGTYLVTGGLGGMGLALARFLARSVGANLVLTSRTGLVDRAGWATWIDEHGEDDPVSASIRAVEALERDGARVRVAAADVADLEAMQEVVAGATAEFGPIHGVVHAAGVPGTGVILRTDRTAADAVMSPKLLGARVLGRLFAEGELDFMVLCSSVAAIKGDVGQVDYCAANAYLDAFARHFGGRTGTFTVAIDWNRWREVGMAVEAARARGIDGALSGCSNEEGAEVLRRILASRLEPQVVITSGDLWHELSQAAESSPAEEEAGESRPAVDGLAHPRPAMATEFVAPSSATEATVAEIWQRMLGVEPIGVHDEFFELGGHSLLAIQVLSRLREAFDLPLALADIYDTPTVRGLALSIEERLIAQIEDLDEDEVTRILESESEGGEGERG